MSGVLNSLIVGIISGIVSSIIIYFLVFKVKPKIKISDKIAKSRDKSGNVIYRIKIINKTHVAIFNLNYSLYYCVKRSDGIITVVEIPPAKSSLFFISPFNKKDNDEKYAVRISYNIDENQYCLNDRAYLCFKIMATHGFSNTSSYIEKDYLIDDIVEGTFETGASMRILSIGK